MPRKKSNNDPNPPRTLRERAEEMLRTSRTDIAEMTSEDVQRLVHELQIHQMELELQNEELRDAQVELAQTRDRYADPYEFAPVGYVLLDHEGEILEANLTIARLLGVVRSELVGKKLSNFIARQSQDVFYLHRQEVFASGAKRTCELQMQREDQRWIARLETTARPDENGAIGQCRTAISDVSQTIDRIQQEIQQRFDASPSFFTLARETPQIVENLWRQAEFAYLDNPLPSLFKEKLFTYLSRFCHVPYCMARHTAFLLGVGRVAGDPDAQAMPAAAVLAMLEKPLPSADEQNRSLALLRDSQPLESWPKPGSSLEDAVFFSCILIFLGLRGRSETFAKPRASDQLQSELQRVLGPSWYDQLILFLSFVSSAHLWTETHPQLAHDSDVEQLLSEQQSLADWIASYHDTISDELQQRVAAELADLTEAHSQLEESFEALQADFDTQAQELARTEEGAAELGRILEQLHNEIYVFDAESLNFILVNRHARNNLGYTMDELRRLTPLDLEPAYTAETFAELVKPLRSGQPEIIFFITWHHRTDGSPYDVEVHLQMSHFQGRPCFVAIVLDVTERRKTERELRRMSKVYTDSADAIFIKDLSGRIVDANAAAQRQYGWTRDELIGKSIKMLVPPEEHECREELMARCLRGEEVRSVEVSGMTKSGEVLPMLLTLSLLTDDGGQPTGIATIAEDITSLKHAEEALRGEHELSESIIETAQHIILVLDTDGCIVRFNPYFEQLTGWGLDEVRGRDWCDIFLSEHTRQKARILFGRALRGELTRGIFNVILTKDGSEREIEWCDAPLTGSEGKLIGLLSTGSDVTERKALESHLLEIANEEQRRIGQDLHDGVGQELSGLGMMADALRASLTRKAVSEASIAEKLTDGLKLAVGHVRALARGLNPVEIDPCGLRSALEVLTQQATALYGIPCIFDCEDDVLVECAEVSTQLYRIAQEAMNNAVIHGKGTELRITLARDSGNISLQVLDNGLGIQKGPELGLGLRSMDYRAGAIGGRLLVQQRDNGGTIVRCSVPAPTSAG